MASPELATLLPKLNERENLDTISPTAVLTSVLGMASLDAWGRQVKCSVLDSLSFSLASPFPQAASLEF